MSGEWIAGMVAVVVSLLLEVVPGLSDWWDGLEATWRRLIWLGGSLAVPLVVLGAGCAGIDLGVTAPACDGPGVVKALEMGFAAYFAAQATYAIVSKPLGQRLARGK